MTARDSSAYARQAALLRWSRATPDERSAAVAPAVAAASAARTRRAAERAAKARAEAIYAVEHSRSDLVERALQLVGHDDPLAVARQVALLNAAEEARNRAAFRQETEADDRRQEERRRTRHRSDAEAHERRHDEGSADTPPARGA